MKKLFYGSTILFTVIAFGLICFVSVNAAKPGASSCTTIQDGTLLTSGGDVITTGFMENGYNYQAHLYNALWGEDKLVMKWNDAWLSNQDCDRDGLLDRPDDDGGTYIGSGAWVTNHWSGNYESTETYHWDISGTWMLDFNGGDDNRQFVNLVQDADNNVTGEFWWLTGGVWEYGGTLIGTVTGDSLHLDYDRTPILYTGVFDGTIGDGVITAGTFVKDGSSTIFNWTATGTSVKTYEMCYWNEFIKIVAVPEGSNIGGPTVSDPWGYEYPTYYNADREVIGLAIWGSFAITMDVFNDPCGEINTFEGGVFYKGDTPTGFGFYKP